MFEVTRVGDKNTGHDGYAAVPLIEGAKSFFINGKPIGLVGCKYEAHSTPNGGTHQDYIKEGASNFIVEGKAVGRVGDAVAEGGTIAEGASGFIVGNKGGQDYGIELGFPATEQVLSSRKDLTKVDEVILATPYIAENEGLIDRSNENDKKAWLELSKMLKFWLMGDAYELKDEDIKLGTAPIYTLSLDWDWALSYDRFFNAYEDLRENALSEAGCKELVNSLKKYGIWEDGGNFNFSLIDSKEWENYYFNLRSVDSTPIIPIFADGMAACLANHTIRVLAAGSVKAINDGIREISIVSLYFYINDRFQFFGEYDLKYWSKEKLDFFSFWSQDETYVNLKNSDFNFFRNKVCKGRDFLVLSSLYKVDKEYVFYAD